MTKRDRKILVVTGFGHFVSHFNMLVFPALVLPLAARLNMPLSEIFGLSLLMYLLFGLTALPWGLAADRYGAKPFLLLYFLGSGISAIAAGFVMDSPQMLILALAGLGLFSGIYHPTGLGLISKEVEEISMAMGYNGMFGNLGLASGPFLASLFLKLWGLDSVYLIVGIINLAGLVIMAFLKIETTDGSSAEVAGDENKRLVPFIFLLIVMMLAGLSYRGITVTLPAYLELKGELIAEFVAGIFSGGESRHLVASALTALIFMTGVLGQYIGGRVGSRFEPRRSYLLFHAICLPAIFFMGFTSNLALVVVSAIYLFFLLGVQPIENTLVARMAPRRFHHSAYGTKFILAFGVGSFAVKIVGWLQGGWGFESVYFTLSAVTLMILVMILFMMRFSNPLK